MFLLRHNLLRKLNHKSQGTDNEGQQCYFVPREVRTKLMMILKF